MDLVEDMVMWKIIVGLTGITIVLIARALWWELAGIALILVATMTPSKKRGIYKIK